MSSPDIDAAANAVDAVQHDITADVTSPSPANVAQTVADVGDLVSQPAITNVFHDAPQIVEETRRGWKTTEFWGVVAAAITAVGPIDVTDKNKLVVGGLAVFYAVARGLAKLGSPNITG